MPERLLTQDGYIIRPKLDPEGYKRIIYDPGRVTRIIMNRPRYKNATSHAHLAELEDAFDRAAQDTNCHVIVLSGAGDDFCSGDDVIGLSPEGAPTLWDGAARSPVQLIEQYGSESASWYQYNTEHDYWITWAWRSKLRKIPKPTIAMVQGYCIFKGWHLAMDMDLCFASENALFLQAGISDSNGLWAVGPRKALELVYEHRFLTAREALELRLINRVYPDFKTLERETMAFAYRVAHEPTIGLRHSKEGLLNTLDIMGYSTAEELGRQPFFMSWRRGAEDGSRMRFEGRGMARSPVALANLKRKLELEGKEVPEHLEAAIARAIQRDDRGAWQRALHQDFRAGDRVARTDARREAYDKMVVEEEKLLREECKRRDLNYEDMRSPYDKYVLAAKAKQARA